MHPLTNITVMSHASNAKYYSDVTCIKCQILRLYRSAMRHEHRRAKAQGKGTLLRHTPTDMTRVSLPEVRRGSSCRSLNIRNYRNSQTSWCGARFCVYVPDVCFTRHMSETRILLSKIQHRDSMACSGNLTNKQTRDSEASDQSLLPRIPLG